jgi:hypothetical protein
MMNSRIQALNVLEIAGITSVVAVHDAVEPITVSLEKTADASSRGVPHFGLFPQVAIRRLDQSWKESA